MKKIEQLRLLDVEPHVPCLAVVRTRRTDSATCDNDHMAGAIDPESVARALSRSYLFEGMRADQLAPLARSSKLRHYARGQFVFHAGDAANEIYVVESGEVKDCVVDVDGNETIHFVHGPGMTFGEPGFFSQDRFRVVDVIAMRRTTLIPLERDALTPFMDQHHVIKDRVLERLASDTRFQAALVSALLTRPLAERLVLRLLELSDSTPVRAGKNVTPKITQSTLAAMIGVSRENVNRALSALALDGSIRLEGGRYVLVDEEKLRRDLAKGWPLARRRDRGSGDQVGAS